MDWYFMEWAVEKNLKSVLVFGSFDRWSENCARTVDGPSAWAVHVARSVAWTYNIPHHHELVPLKIAFNISSVLWYCNVHLYWLVITGLSSVLCIAYLTS